ncbi:hypothetical protein [Massilia genomosp. 1]|uniref:hypothetical protein n=1 Tax=Massilia genomosp. 1 TaxID=2609280 RepID=UPI001651BE0B|nr:hypothetical protein [Massilia genomosp. 1]
MRYLLLILLALVLLTSCAGAPRVMQEVKVPVYCPCLTAAPARPTFATRALDPGASDGEKVLALARDHLVHFKYEGELEAVIAGACERRWTADPGDAPDRRPGQVAHADDQRRPARALPALRGRADRAFCVVAELQDEFDYMCPHRSANNCQCFRRIMDGGVVYRAWVFFDACIVVDESH